MNNNNKSLNNSTKKISQHIFCDITYAYSRGGGITTYINGKAAYYKTNKIRHIIITPRNDDGLKVVEERDAGQSIYRVPSRRIMIDTVPYYFFRGYSDIEKILKKEKPTLIEIGDSFTTFFYGKKIKSLISQQGGKVVVFVHERLDNFYQQVFKVRRGIFFWRYLKNIFAELVTKILLIRFLATADAVIANSIFSAQEARARTLKPVYTLALGIDVQRYYQAQRDQKLSNELSNDGRKSVLLHIGRLENDKKIDLLLDFAQRLDDKKFLLVIIGDGKFKDILSTMPAVRATGYLKQDEILSYIMAADLGVLVNDIEPFGLVALEMMAGGLPMLAPNKGGLSSFIKPEINWLLPYNVSAYLKALTEWSQLSSQKKDALRLAARVDSKNYTIEKMGDRLMALYQKII